MTHFEPMSTNSGSALQPGTNVELKFSTIILNKGNVISEPSVSEGDTYQLQLFLTDEDSLDSATVRALLSYNFMVFPNEGLRKMTDPGSPVTSEIVGQL